MRIPISISQDAAIKAGSNKYGADTVEVDVAILSEDQRTMLAALINPGIREADRYLKMGDHGIATKEAITERLQELIDADKKKLQDRLNLKERIVAILLAMDAETFNARGNCDSVYDQGVWVASLSDIIGEAEADPRLANKISARRMWRQERDTKQAAERREEDRVQVERDARERAEKEAKRQQDAAKAAEKKAQIVAWVAANGTENQQKRLAAGLLPDQEIVDTMRDEGFQSLASLEYVRGLDGGKYSLPLYESLKAGDVCICEDTYGERHCHVDFESSIADSATAEQFDQMEKMAATIHAVHPDAVLELRVHEGKGESCENAVKKFGIKVSLTVGAFKFNREYAVIE